MGKETHSKQHHPLDVLPEGNLLINGVSNIRDVGGFGKFKALQDVHISDILEYLDTVSMCQLMLASRAFYAFCNAEDYWMQFVLSQFNGEFQYDSFWRQTYINCICQQYKIVPPRIEFISCKGLYSDVLFQRWYCAKVEIQKRWISKESIPRVNVADLTPEKFTSTYVTPRQPVIITGLIDDWQALRKWKRQYLIEQSKDIIFEAGGVQTTMENFFRYADENNDEVPAFIFDPKFADNVPQFSKDYQVPELFKDDLFSLLKNRPNYRWLLVGNKGSGSKWHIDPNRTHAWNAVISGSKHWLLLPPGHPPPGVYPSVGGGEVIQPLSLKDWYLNFYEHSSNGAAGAPVLEGTCRAGELIFIPSECWHAVLNSEDDTIAITHNCVTPEIVNAVRWFLKYRQEQVSGVSEERKKTLWQEFDEALLQQRKELLTPLPPPPNLFDKDHQQSFNCNPLRFPHRKKQKLIRTKINDESSPAVPDMNTCTSSSGSNLTVDTTPSISFWDQWKASHKKVVIVPSHLN